MRAIVLPLLLIVVSCTATDPPVFIDEGTKAGGAGCVDNDPKCSVWASQGECQTNAAWMMGNCRRSCQSCQGGDRAWKLRTHIAASYDNTSGIQNFTTNNVMIQNLRIDHLEIDEKSEIMKAHGRLVLSWNDTRLIWDRDQWGISWLNFYWIQIWTPQIIQTNSPNAQPGVISGKVLAANYTGQVFMWTDFSFSAPCPFDYSAYPNDRQECCFKIDDKRYFAVKFKVNDETKRLAQESGSETHLTGWKVDNVDVHENNYVIKVLSDWKIDPYDVESTNCEICVRVKRNAPYYASELIAPAIATAVITLASFLIGDFGMQLWLLIASIALQLCGMIVINARLPPTTSSNPTILKFYGFNMAATITAFVVTVLLYNLSHLRSSVPSPHFVDLFLGTIERFIPCLRVDANEDKLTELQMAEGGSGGGSPGKRYYASLACALKFLVFLFLFAIYLLVMFSSFAI